MTFLQKHGIYPENEEQYYHYLVSLYYMYQVDAMQKAGDIEDGLVIDEEETAAVLLNLKEAQEVYTCLKKKIKQTSYSLDLSEEIALKGCRIKQGCVIGDCEEALSTARMWIQKYIHGKVNSFVYEVGIYILFLLGKDIDYSFLLE